MKLIMNADDFGLTRGVNFGIIDAYQSGIVRSTTLMPGGAAFEHAVSLAKENPGLGIGVHLTLTYGKPILSGHKTLTDAAGNFLKLSMVESRDYKADPSEVEKEYIAQIEKVLAAGLKPTHLDSHHHTHMLDINLPIFFKMAEKYNLPVRLRNQEQRGQKTEIKCPEKFEESFFGDTVSLEYLQKILIESNKAASIEVMCHPAYVDEPLYKGSSYNLPRTKELSVLTSEEIKIFINENKIELTNFTNI